MISTIRFQKIVQLVQVIRLKLTHALELFDYLSHQLVLLEVLFEFLWVLLLRLVAKVLRNDLIDLISFVYLFGQVMHEILLAGDFI